ncbi:class I SAM-dependent methyltransferase [Winogradskyella aurantiaca]|uniref:hypothetical protein n=1 Tax=Winogradskyella aurantiaca TaxID=2219558 RepID=UPI0013001BD1|nr:hypothetical protein [Winogradskyella aurantiaca]
MKKLVKWIYNRFVRSRQRVLERKMSIRTKSLKENEESDLQRWKKTDELKDDWSQRTHVMSTFLSTSTNIIEFGAGNMYLKSVLGKEQNYTPSDLVKRFDETIICDLNNPIEIDLTPYDAAVFSGVLEYVYNLDLVFKKLHEDQVAKVVLSYACSDRVNLSRSANGWLSDYTLNDIKLLIDRYDYIILDYKEWRDQSIFNLSLNN